MSDHDNLCPALALGLSHALKDIAVLGIQLRRAMLEINDGRQNRLPGRLISGCGLHGRKLLRLTRMDSVFRVHNSLVEGLDSHFIPRAQAS